MLRPQECVGVVSPCKQEKWSCWRPCRVLWRPRLLQCTCVRTGLPLATLPRTGTHAHVTFILFSKAFIHVWPIPRVPTTAASVARTEDCTF